MRKVTLHVGERVRISGLKKKAIKRIKGSLTLDNPKFAQAVLYSGYSEEYIRVPRYIEMYKKRYDKIEVPRGFILDPKILKSAKIIDETTTSKVVTYPKLLITPRKEQRLLMSKFSEELSSNTPKRPFNNFLVVQEVSAGKTIASALMAMATKQRTLVLVHTTLIMSAWIEDLCKMFGPAYRKEIGIIQGTKAKIGKHFTIAMLQTWNNRQEQWDDWWSYFGTMIFDEVHICPANMFQDCANNAPTKYRIGITGTPKRKDGLHNIMYLVFGTPFYTMRTKGEETDNSLPVSDLKILSTASKLPRTVKQVFEEYVDGRKETVTRDVKPDGQRDYRLIINTLCADEDRTALIASEVVDILKENKYNSVLVTAHTISHVKKIAKAIREIYKGKVACLYGARGKKYIVAAAQKLIARKIRCTVSTLQLVKTGTSIPPWNRLVIATPIGGTPDIEQLTGRIRRKCEHKTDAKIVHVVDYEIPLCHRHFLKRALPFYRERLKIKNLKNTYIA